MGYYFLRREALVGVNNDSLDENEGREKTLIVPLNIKNPVTRKEFRFEWLSLQAKDEYCKGINRLKKIHKAERSYMQLEG